MSLVGFDIARQVAALRGWLARSDLPAELRPLYAAKLAKCEKVTGVSDQPAVLRQAIQTTRAALLELVVRASKCWFTQMSSRVADGMGFN